MDCKYSQDLFTLYLDRDLDDTTAIQFRTHLASCDHCAQEWEYYQKTIRLIKMIEPVPVPSNLLTGIHQKLEKNNLLIKLNRWFRQARFSVSFSYAATGLVIFLTVSTLFYAHHREKGLPTSPIIRETAEIEKDTFTPPSFNNEYEDHPPPLFFAHPSKIGSSYESNINYVIADSDRFSSEYTYFPEELPIATEIQTEKSLAPDIIATVHTSTLESRINLYRLLLKKNKWDVRTYKNDLLLIYLSQSELPELYNALADEKVIFSPFKTGTSDFGSSRRSLTVAVSFQ